MLARIDSLAIVWVTVCRLAGAGNQEMKWGHDLGGCVRCTDDLPTFFVRSRGSPQDLIWILVTFRAILNDGRSPDTFMAKFEQAACGGMVET